jgi:SAM-dependent methyltransferase
MICLFGVGESGDKGVYPVRLWRWPLLVRRVCVLVDLTNRCTPAILSAEEPVSDESHQGKDPTILREQAYADDTQLDIRRRTHQLYTVEPVDLGRWTLERLPWRGDERVLDVGCGPGDLLCAMARHNDRWSLLAGSDFSAGMAAEAAQSAAGLPVRVLVADAQANPFPDGWFDVVMARHMLYHVPDIDRAVAEAARVLRPGGTFLATTNGAHTMPEYFAIREQAARRFPAMTKPDFVTHRFCLENGEAFLEPYFVRVESHFLPGLLRFPTAQPFIDYFASSRALTMPPGHTEAEWQAVLDFVRAEAEAIVERQGRIEVTKITGAIVGVKGD